MNKRKKSIKRQVLQLIFCWIVFVGSAFAAAQSAVTSVVNELDTGVIDISLKEYMLDENGKEVAWKDQTAIMPGDFISKIPKITNKAMDCWVRAKVKLTSKSQYADSLSLDNIEGISDDWVKIGNYFYYKNVLKTKETVTLFQSIQIPAQWQKEHEENEIQIVVQVDAVQAKNFTPDFGKETPWGGLVVEKCTHENGYDMNAFRVAKESSLRVTYDDTSQKLLANPDDFFSQFGTLMPGDEQTETVTIRNKDKQSVNIYFKTEALEEAKILEKIQLKIENRASKEEKSRVIYEGNLNAKKIGQYILLGCYEAGYDGQFIFTLKMPKELNNAYSLEKRKVKWYFMSEKISNPLTPSTSTNTSTSTVTSTSTSTSRVTSTSTASKTKTTTQTTNKTYTPYSSYEPEEEEDDIVSNNKQSSNNPVSTPYSSTKGSADTSPYASGGEDGNILQKIQPKTKDETRTALFFGCAIVSLVGIMITTKNLKKTRKQ